MTAVTLARRIVPAGPESAGLVEQLWVARAAHGAPPRVALPDGRPAVVARLGAPVRWLDPLTREDDTVGSVVRGPRTVPRVILPTDPAAATWEVGARLTPYALSALHPDGFLVDDHRPLGEALDLDSDALAVRLRACWPGDDPDPAGPAVAAARTLEATVVAAVRRPIPTLRRDELDRVVQLADDERGLVRSGRSTGRSPGCTSCSPSSSGSPHPRSWRRCGCPARCASSVWTTGATRPAWWPCCGRMPTPATHSARSSGSPG